MTQIDQTMAKPVLSVAIIGAGISGVIAARTLADEGMQVTVFEKSRGVGGRMATRRGENETSFDHGAQYFTVRDEQFRRYVESWQEQGLVKLWPDRERGADQRVVVIRNGKIESESESIQRWVALPAMNSICKHLANGLEVVTQTRIGRIESVNGGIRLCDEHGTTIGTFDRLIITAPAGQTAELLGNFPALRDRISPIRMNPCWATMASFDRAITEDWVGAFLHDSFLSWAARNGTKPGRSKSAETLILHANPEWTSKQWEREPDAGARESLDEFWRVTGLHRQTPKQLQAHRWKYAIPVEPSAAGCFHDAEAGIVACGDWAGGSRVEGAFLSGLMAAHRLVETL